MERMVLEVVDQKEIKRLTKTVREMEESVERLAYKIKRDERDYTDFVDKIQTSSSAQNKLLISVDQDHLRKKQQELDAVRNQLGLLLEIQSRIERVKNTRAELQAVEEELNSTIARRNESKVLYARLPSVIAEADWKINNVLLPKSSRLKDELERLEKEN
jgi:hypothetical protein